MTELRRRPGCLHSVPGRASASPGLRRQARGRTLLELLVAMVLSAGVLMAIAVYYSGASRTAAVAHQLSAMNDEAPLAMLMLGQSIKRAGSGEIIGVGYTAANQTMFEGAHLRGCKSSTCVDPATGNFNRGTASPSAQDALLVRFQANSVVGPDQIATRNCVGGPAVTTPITTPTHVAVGALVPIVMNVFSFDAGQLRCSGNGSAPEVLARDVTEFRLYYGFDEQGATLALGSGLGLAPIGSTIVDADQIRAREAAFAASAFSPWDFVVSVHVCLVMRTRQAATSVQGAAFAYVGCPETPAQVSLGDGPARTSNDGAIRRTYRQVFTVRSRATASPSIGT